VGLVRAGSALDRMNDWIVQPLVPNAASTSNQALTRTARRRAPAARGGRRGGSAP
jgi:hypothetical protein